VHKGKPIYVQLSLVTLLGNNENVTVKGNNLTLYNVCFENVSRPISGSFACDAMLSGTDAYGSSLGAYRISANEYIDINDVYN